LRYFFRINISNHRNIRIDPARRFVVSLEGELPPLSKEAAHGRLCMFDIKDYEAMAMLYLRDEEHALIHALLERLFESFAVLEKIDTDDVLPLVTVLDTRNVMRDDRAGKLFSREEILANAPEQYDGYYQVPGTLGQ